MQNVQTRQPALGPRLRAELDRFFAGLGQGCNAYLETVSRAKELERLSSMTDVELSNLGISDRSEIVRHVFRDRFYI